MRQTGNMMTVMMCTGRGMCMCMCCCMSCPVEVKLYTGKRAKLETFL